MKRFLLPIIIGIAAGIIGFAAAQTQPAGTITLDAGTVYTEDISVNPIDSWNQNVCRNGTFLGWRHTSHWSTQTKPWNGIAIYSEQIGSSNNYNVYFVGSALESGVSRQAVFDANCSFSHASVARRSIKLNVQITGTIPAHRAPESIHHGHHHTDGLHPDAAPRVHTHSFAVQEHTHAWLTHAENANTCRNLAAFLT